MLPVHGRRRVPPSTGLQYALQSGFAALPYPILHRMSSPFYATLAWCQGRGEQLDPKSYHGAPCMHQAPHGAITAHLRQVDQGRDVRDASRGLYANFLRPPVLNLAAGTSVRYLVSTSAQSIPVRRPFGA
jgi:hypothetical protein